MPTIDVSLTRDGLVPATGRLVRRSRSAAGWSQRELAQRAGTSQATVWRLETGQPQPVDLAVVERLLDALGLRVTLGIDDRHLRDRERQRDGVHARVSGYTARRLGRDRWDAVVSEVQIGTGRPRGWIDTLGYREADRSLLVEETKADILDMGDLQRQFAFYMREAREVADRLGWRPRRVVGLVVGLDSEALAARLRANRELLAEAFPSPVASTAAWLRDASLPPPTGWTLALADPLFRGDRWLRSVPGLARRRPSAYRDYRDAAMRLGVDGHRAGDEGLGVLLGGARRGAGVRPAVDPPWSHSGRVQA